MGAAILYDGDCPFCSRFVRYVRFGEAVGGTRLIDAREDGPEVSEAKKRGLSLDEGMILILGDAYYHGSDAMNRIALMSSRSNLFNKLNYRLFRSPRAARVAYPVLRACRNLALRALGRPGFDDRA